MEKTRVQEIINNIPEILNPTFLWIIFGLAVVITAIFSIALLYHWREYASVHHKKLVLAEKVYLIVTIVLLITSLSTLIIYVNSL